jgi:hypothetical protein
MTMRVVFASDVDDTKVVGAPSRDVKIGDGAGSDLGSMVIGPGIVFGTRWIDEHAATLTATRPRRRLHNGTLSAVRLKSITGGRERRRRAVKIDREM